MPKVVPSASSFEEKYILKKIRQDKVTKVDETNEEIEEYVPMNKS